MRMQPQTTPSTVGYMAYNGSTGVGKTKLILLFLLALRMVSQLPEAQLHLLW